MDPEKIKEGLKLVMEYGNSSEKDLFIFRTSLEYHFFPLKTTKQTRLLMMDLNLAKNFMNLFQKEGHSGPLFNFFTFMLETIIEKNFALFQVLLEKYKRSLNRDPLFLEVNFFKAGGLAKKSNPLDLA